MAVLHLGVIEFPYQDNSGVTTGDVAEILESKYHVMEIFTLEHGQNIADSVAASYLTTMEAAFSGSTSIDKSGLSQAQTDITAMFKDFIATGEMEKLGYPGVPTQAAINRKSGRFKSGKSAAGRPSFYDTGLYQSSAWVWGDAIPGMAEYGQAFAGLEGLYA